MRIKDISESVAGPEKCWPGHRKVGTQPGTGKNAGKRVNDCEKIKEDDLKEFAPGSGGESGRWYTDDQMTDIVGDGWWQDLDVGGNIPKQAMIQEAQAWLDDQGYSVQVLNCKLNDDDMEWYIQGSFDNPGFANEGAAEGYNPVESDYTQWEQILQKDGYRMAAPSGAAALDLVVGHQGGPSDYASSIRNILTYVKQNRGVLGKAVADRKTVKDAIMDIKNEYPQFYQAAQQPQGVAEGFDGEYDDEAGMADNNLETLARAVQGIDDLIQTGDNLPEWCQEKIAVAKSMLVAVWDYMESEEDSEDPEIAEMYEAMNQLAEEIAYEDRVSVDTVWETLERLDDQTLFETAAWRRKAGKSAKGGLNAKGVASYRRENPGSKLQMAVTTKPSKLKPGSKAAKRRKSFCARMSGVKGPMKKPNGKPTRKALALRKWNC